MRPEQLKYVRERARKVYDEKCIAIREQFKPIKLSLEARLACLRNGNFTIADAADKYDQYGIEQYIVYEGQQVGNTEAAGAAQKALDKTYVALTDELILGDNEKALELLRAFEAA